REQDRPHSRDGRGLLLFRQPAQSRHPILSPAGLVTEAADLSRRLAERAAAEHARARSGHYPAADPGQQAQRRLLVAEELRQQLRGDHYAAISARELEKSRDGEPA